MQPKVILLAEDNPDDAFIFEIMFQRAKLPHKLHIVRNGQEAIDWLSGRDNSARPENVSLPDILLLDLKLPIKNGFEVTEWLRAEKQFHDFPVVILSSSDDSRDMKRAQQLGVAKYFVKSPKLQDVMSYLRAL